MSRDKVTEEILRRRMHGLYLSRGCSSLSRLASDLLGLHCWFHRNVAFSALIRGADLTGWKTALTKTWLYRGTLHGAVYEELPLLLALHADALPWDWFQLPYEEVEEVARRVMYLMEDGVCSRAEMRRVFAQDYPPETVSRLFSPWGGIFVYLARQGKVSFRGMTSRDFELISAEPVLTPREALEKLIRRFFAAYGPATLADAAWFFGLDRPSAAALREMDLSDLMQLEWKGQTLYYPDLEVPEAIPRLALLSGFDPYLVSYVDRETMLPPAFKKAVILSSGICLPTVAIDGVVAGLWNIKGKEPTVRFFGPQPKRLRDEALAMVEAIRFQTAGRL